MHNPTLAAAALALLSSIPAAQAGIYTKSSPVIQVDAKSYDRLVAKTNHTTIVEFYAPWCGHCQNLKPAYEKAAKNLEGLAHVAAVDCDEDANKPLCGQFGVQGFPTLKIVRPNNKKGAKPIVEDYQGQRTAKAIVDAVVDKINNHVKKLTDKDVEKWLDTKKESPKAILFTEKGSTSALLKSIAIDFLDVIGVAQVRNKETQTVEKFGITKFPTLVLIPGGDKAPAVYEGELKKADLVKFLTQAGEPNPDPAPEKAKAKKEKKEKKPEKKEQKQSKPKEPVREEPVASSESSEPTEIPEAKDKSIPAIPAINSAAELDKECLNRKSRNCFLALVPKAHGESPEKALNALSEIAAKQKAHGRGFSFFEVHIDSNEGAVPLIETLNLAKEVEIIFVNGKRGWWKHYQGDLSPESIESWVGQVTMGEGAKQKLPDGLVKDLSEEKPAAEKIDVKVEEEIKIELDGEKTPTSASFQGAEPTPERTEPAEESPVDHDEL